MVAILTANLTVIYSHFRYQLCNYSRFNQCKL